MEVCAKHLHESPAVPSEVLGRAVPRDLEAVVLACLEKKREARPQSARALRELRSSCAIDGRWTWEQAAEWWKHRVPRPQASATPRPLSLTLDLGGRDGEPTFDEKPPVAIPLA